MPEDLDPTTARLVSELASSILPPLTRSLNSAIPQQADLSVITERISTASQDLRTTIEKSLRSGFEDNRAGRSVMLQSLGKVLEEISALRKTLDTLPQRIEASINFPDIPDSSEALNGIRELISELIEGIRTFTETYAASGSSSGERGESGQISFAFDSRLDKLLDSLPELEGLVRAGNRSHSHELEELSRELSSLQEQNNAALIHELREAAASEMTKNSEEISAMLEAGRDDLGKKIYTLLKITACLSGACIFLTVIMFLILMFR